MPHKTGLFTYDLYEKDQNILSGTHYDYKDATTQIICYINVPDKYTIREYKVDSADIAQLPKKKKKFMDDMKAIAEKNLGKHKKREKIIKKCYEDLDDECEVTIKLLLFNDQSKAKPENWYKRYLLPGLQYGLLEVWKVDADIETHAKKDIEEAKLLTSYELKPPEKD